MSDSVVSRLNKVRGQIDGIVRMYESERDCVDVVTQITAARAALASVGRDLLSDEALSCSRDNRDDKLDTVLKELFKLT